MHNGNANRETTTIGAREGMRAETVGEMCPVTILLLHCIFIFVCNIFTKLIEDVIVTVFLSIFLCQHLFFKYAVAQ